MGSKSFSKHLQVLPLLTVFVGFASVAQTLDEVTTIKALRLANTITGGYMPTSDPLFTQMISQIAAGNMLAAAQTAANSNYFASYMARRLALQMQTPALDASVATDNDSTAFIIGHFVGTATTSPSISTLLSENATYTVSVIGANAHVADLTPAQLAEVDWTKSLVRSDGQNATMSSTQVKGPIPSKHVGGFATLSDRAADNSFAMYGASAGTNLRMIEGIWEIMTGLQLIDFESTDAPAQAVPRFVPELDPNFFHGQGQPACIACHGGGLSSLNHGYAAVGDVFDYDARSGFTYVDVVTTATRKSLGSDPNKRAVNLACNLVQNPTATCNPDSAGVDPNQSWDVSATWSNSGVLKKLGWTAATSGQGLNALGAAIGQAGIVYEFLTKRVINELCPLATISEDDIAKVAAAANPFALPKAGTDDIRTIVALVASNPACQ